MIRTFERLLCVAVVGLCIRPGFGAAINLTSGTPGTVLAGQSFNETRGVDVTVLGGSSLTVASMTLNGLRIGAATSALVGARIYDSSTTALLASADAIVSSGGSITVPIAASLAPGASYRLAFFVQTTPASLASGDVFDPDPPSLGGFPYTESSGSLRINSAHAISTDSFPANNNTAVPIIELCVAGQTPTPARIFLSTRLSGESHEVTAQPGSTVILYVFVEDTVSAGVGKLAAYNVVVECEGSSIPYGSVSHHPTPGSPPIGCPGGTSPCVDVSNPEWVYSGANTSFFLFGLDSGACPLRGSRGRRPRFQVFASQAEAVDVCATPRLLGEIAYKISPDAGGPLADPVVILNTGGSPLTSLTSDTGQAIQFTFNSDRRDLNNPLSPFDGVIIHITQACCLGPPPTCSDVDADAPAGCLNQGGELMGPGSKCVPNGTFGIGTVVDACQPVVVPPGRDEWFTPDDGAKFDFCETPIPADFFEPGSQPFMGMISLGGGASPGGGPDTIVQRLANLTFDARIEPDCVFEPCMSSADACIQGCGFCSIGGQPCARNADCTPPETCESLVSRVDVEIMGLDLVSTQPIEVEMCTGDPASCTTAPVLWTVRATLSSISQDPGALCACRTSENGGVYNAAFRVKAEFEFCKVNDPAFCWVFDPAAMGMVLNPITLQTVALPDFVFRTDLGLPFTNDNFTPGVKDDPDIASQCCKLVCHDAVGGTVPGFPPPPGHQHCANGKISCDGCLIGACGGNPGSLPFACNVVAESECPPGLFMGAGTNCDDIDFDGIPDVLEKGDCCGLRSAFGVPSNPNMFDTDNDGCSDSEELSALNPTDRTDPCDPCDFPPTGCHFQPPTVSGCPPQQPSGNDCNGNGRNDALDIKTKCSVDLDLDPRPDDAQCPPPCASPNTKTYCLTGLTSGQGFAWCVGDGSYSICDLRVRGVDACCSASALVPPFIDSINSVLVPSFCGMFSAATVTGASACFTIEACSTPPFDLKVGANGIVPTCVVGASGCEFNPMIVQVTPTGRDCNGNGIDDALDIGGGFSLDCNGNFIPDDCDIASGTSDDLNGDGIPDECQCVVAAAPLPDVILDASGVLVPSAKSRFLSFSGGDPGLSQAVRVTFKSLPGLFAIFDGTSAWVDLPQLASELSGKRLTDPVVAGEPTFLAAELGVTPVFADWSAFGVVHVYDERIIPSRKTPTAPLEPAIYEIQFVSDGCNLNSASSFSIPLEITNAQWADIAQLAGGDFRAPDGTVGVDDILALLAKFVGAAGAPIKARAELLGVGGAGPEAAVDGVISVSDLLEVLSAFGGGEYPF